MNALQDAQSCLQQYCIHLLTKLEQALENYSMANVQDEQDEIFTQIKSYSSDLSLLLPFYSATKGKTQGQQIQKLCFLLKHKNYQENDAEQVALLTKIFQVLASFSTLSSR